MKYGISVPNFGEYFQPRVVADLARQAEDAGFDGFFTWDHMLFWRNFKQPVSDPWIALSAIALATERIRIGPMVTPLPRRRPWKLARETVTLDHLSNGRLILGVGLGFPPDAEYETFGEEGDSRVRAERLDEGLAVLTGLWGGQPFAYEGRHYQLWRDTFLPTPLQQPRIPIWVAAMWPNMRPLRRAARWDGLFIIDARGVPLDVESVARAVATSRSLGAGDDFDVVAAYAGGDISAYAEAGVTWLIDGPGPTEGVEDLSTMIRKGPRTT